MPTRNLRTNEKRIGIVLNRNIRTVEREVIGHYRKALDQIRVDMSKIYERYAKDGVLSHADMTQYNRLTNLDKQITRILQEANRATVRDVKRLKSYQYEEAFFRHAWAIDQSTGVSLSWGQLNPDTVKAAVANPLDLITQARLKSNSLLSIRTAVTQGMIQGNSYPQMMKAIKGKINGTAYDATRIVRTEGQRAQVLGQQAVYDRAEGQGVEGSRIWDATLDMRTRPHHQALDGVPETMNADGTHGGWTFPGGVHTTGPLQSGVAAEDINCRCRLRFEIVELKPEIRRTRDGGVEPYQIYEEWGVRNG